MTNTAAAPTQPDPALPQAESALPQPESASAINSHNPDLQSAPDASHGEAPPAPIEATQTPIEAPWHEHQTNPNPGTSTQ